jgi:hypothetical protein
MEAAGELVQRKTSWKSEEFMYVLLFLLPNLQDPAKSDSRLLETKITLKITGGTLLDLCRELRDRTGASVLIDPVSIPEPEKLPVTCVFTDLALKSALTLVLMGRDLTYAVVEGHLVFTNRESKESFEKGAFGGLVEKDLQKNQSVWDGLRRTSKLEPGKSLEEGIAVLSKTSGLVFDLKALKKETLKEVMRLVGVGLTVLSQLRLLSRAHGLRLSLDGKKIVARPGS